MKLPVVILLLAAHPYFTLGADNTDVLQSSGSFANSSVAILSRRRRYLDFMKSTRVFVRANIKQNLFTFGALWAFAQGYKANNPILNDLGTRPFRRDTYEVLEQIIDLHGFDGQACILNLFCTVTRGKDGEYSGGFLFKLLRHVFK